MYTISANLGLNMIRLVSLVSAY